jgi:MFS family permease
MRWERTSMISSNRQAKENERLQRDRQTSHLPSNLPVLNEDFFNKLVLLLTAGEIITGLGCGMTVPAMTTAVLNAVPKSQVGVASALLNASRQLGGVLGVAILGSILGSLSDRSAFLAGMRIALLLVALLFLLGSMLTSTSWPTKTNGLHNEILASKLGNVKRLHEPH